MAAARPMSKTLEEAIRNSASDVPDRRSFRAVLTWAAAVAVFVQSPNRAAVSAPWAPR
jgi:hypothetical protein